jgi:hypothetical protein
MSSKKGRYVLAIAFCMSILAPAVVSAEDAAVDLIGRGGKFTVIERNGTVSEVPESALSVQNGRSRSYGNLEKIPSDTPATADTEDSDIPATVDNEEPGSESDTPATPELTKGDEPVEETPEEKAAREADARAVRAMLDQGGAYFYDENNNPLSYQQVSTMIRAGDVENIRAQGLHLSTWAPSLNEVKENENTAAPQTSYGGSTAPGTKKSVHEIVAEGKPFQETVKDDPPFDPKKYSASVPEDGVPSPLAIPEERRPFREVLQEDQRKPFDPNKDYTKNY